MCIESLSGRSSNLFCVKDENGTFNKLFGNLEPVVIHDLKENPDIKFILNPENNMKSLLAMPIESDGKPIGVIIVQNKETSNFSEEEINTLRIISHNIASSVINSELLSSLKSQFERLRIIHEIGKAITSILDLDRLLPYICEQVSKFFNAKGCILRLKEGDNLYIRASYGLPEHGYEEVQLKIGEGIAGHVALSGKPMLVDDVAKMPDHLKIPRMDVTSVVCVPLIIGDRIIGTLGLYDKKDEWGTTSFTEGDLEYLLTFASVASIAIENARLYKAEREKEKEVSQTKDYLKSIIDNSADAIITSDLNGLITSWNKGAENIYGFTEEEVLGKFLPMVPPFLIEEEKGYIEKIKRKETLRDIETIRQTKSGKLIEVSLTLSPILDSSGNVTGISGISRDISEKKLVEKELIRKNQELSRLFFINSVIRSTLELDKLLKMVLTVVTMGDGLGFNRAMLFLIDESKNILKGEMGVGPSSPEEAREIWLSMEGKSLGALIEEIERGPVHLDSYLDRLCQEMVIDLNDDCIMTRCIKEKRPFNIRNAKEEPLVTSYIRDKLNAEAFGIVPLIARDKVIGLIWVDNLFTGKPIRDEDLQFLMGFSSHIASAIENARLFENESLARAELKNIFESITDMVYYTDNTFTIKRVNQAVVKRLGIPEDQIVGRKCYEVFHGKNEPWHECPHIKSVEAQKPLVQEIEDPHLGGTFVVSNSPIFDSSGNLVGTVHISRDITELKNLRERVIHSERMAALGELAARVAHEIRNPLISIGGFARRLEKKLDDERKEYARIIVNEVSRLENILKEILGFVKSSRLNKTPVNINALLTEIIDFVKPQTEERGNNIIMNLTETPIIIEADRDRIKQALLNICTNAIQATERGNITIRSIIENGEAMIEFVDTGCGIKEEDLKNIFNPFFTTKPQGTGLGLAVTNKIIEEHNGRISVESKVGHGTTFRIYLPVKEGIK